METTTRIKESCKRALSSTHYEDNIGNTVCEEDVIRMAELLERAEFCIKCGVDPVPDTVRGWLADFERFQQRGEG